MSAILDCAFDRWDPVIGDPTVAGWVTVAIHAAVALLAARLAWRAPFPSQSRARERRFWILLCICFLALAINKQLDLQSFLTATGRCAAKLQGWYGSRRAVQMLFLLGIAFGAVLALWSLFWLFRGTWARTGLPILGLSIVLGFVMMRAVGFHHFDRLLGVQVFSLRGNFVLEVAGPVLVGLSALAQLSRGASRN